MATLRPDRLTDADINKIRWTGTQDRIRDPKSDVILMVNKSGVSFGLMLYKDRRQRWVTLGRFRYGAYGIAQARRDALQRQAEADRVGVEAPVVPVVRTFEAAWEKLVHRHKADGLQLSTRQTYEDRLRVHSPDIWEMPISDVDKAWLQERLAVVQKRRSGVMARAWVVAVSVVLSEAVHWGWLDRNPCIDMKLPKKVAVRGVVKVSEQDVRDLWDAIATRSHPHERAAWTLALLTGLRKRTITMAQWAHLSEGSDGWTLHVPEPKGGAARAFDLPLPAQVMDTIAGLPRYAGDRGRWIFASERSTDKGLELRRIGKLPNAHYARHCWSTVAELAGVPEWPRAVLLNQKPGKSVNSSYTHTEPCHYRSESQKVADFLWSLRSSS